MKRVLLILFFCISCALFAQNTEEAIIKHVEENYIEILEQIPVGNEILFGFENRNMFNECKTGNPIRLLKIVNGSDIELTNQWRVPLLINGTNVILLTVIQQGPTYKIVDLGGKVLAEIIDSYNSENRKISFMIRDYKKSTDYISFEFKSLYDKMFYKIDNNPNNSDKTTNVLSLMEIIELHNIDD